jgi:hypothetical protein
MYDYTKYIKCSVLEINNIILLKISDGNLYTSNLDDKILNTGENKINLRKMCGV